MNPNKTRFGGFFVGADFAEWRQARAGAVEDEHDYRAHPKI
jgi:hypothetical protein